jgi:GT2 family glycosyltransferase
MSTERPAVSVIVPTHNRRDSVRRTLHALAAQTMSPGRFEVIVVADGCEDDTVRVLRGLPLPYRLMVLEQPASGQGKARNLGAAQATGALLVFLDDDIEPFPGLLDAYEREHRRLPGRLLLGPAFPVLPEETSLFSHGLRNWWSDHIQAITRPEHRFSYRDMHSGNFSISAELFARSGGFAPEFFQRSGEDYEFGVRLLALQIPFACAREALARHHDATDLRRSLDRVRKEGRADVLIGLRHPSLRSGILQGWPWRAHSITLTILQFLAVRLPWLGDLLARTLAPALGLLQGLRFRNSWRGLHGLLRTYWYYRGFAEELRASASGISSQRFFREHWEEPVLTPVDLDLGVEAAQDSMDRLQANGIAMHLEGDAIGSIPAVPGAEPLRGVHLPAALSARGYHLLRKLSIETLRSPGQWERFFGGTRDG